MTQSNLPMNNQVGESELIERERPDNLQVQDNIVQPWSIVQKSLRLTIPKSIQSQPVSYSRSDIRPVSSDIRPVTPSKNELKREVDNCTPPTQAITVNTGFQQINAISQPGAFLTSVIHVPGGSQMGSFVGIDSKSAYVWKGGKRNQTMSLGRDVHSSIQSPLMGLTAWIYIPKSRIYLLANKQLQLKILDFNFDYLSHESTEKQALCLEYIESLDEVVVGGAKYVSVFKLLKSTIKGKIVTSFTGPRLIINDFTGDEWVSKTVVHVLSDRLFVVCGSCVYVYNYKTGERLASMKDIHILSITSILFYNKIEYFITASKDSVIKVWNNTYKIVHELRGHSQAVTSLVKPDFNGFSQGDSYLMSCSLDGKLNMWNIENGQLISSFDALDECVGMGFIKRDIFYIHSKDGICTYTMTRAWSSFSRFNSIQLTRHENRDAAARILSMSSDGSLRLLSPLTGALLITGMPIMRDLDPNASVYSFSKETIWVLLKNGDIAIYKCKSNPMSLHEEWNLLTRPGQQDKCVKLELIEYTLSSEEVTVLIGGTDTGQIVFLQDGKMEKIVQAHTASITSLLYDNKNMRLISGGGDNTVKIWSVITAKDEAKIGAISLISLSLITSVNIPSTPIHVFLNTGSLHGMTLAVATLSGSLLMYLVKDEKSKLSIEKLKDHPKDENHTLLISGLCGSKSLNIFATSSLDMTVKVWDGMDNSLLREVQFPSKLTSIAFLNKRGDLLVGLDTEICIIKVQDYLSFNLLRYIMDLEFPDDIQDSGILFDPMLDFWSNGREQLEKNGVELKTWHVEKSKDYSGINRKKTSDLLSLTPEELSNRAGLIKQRKIKRLYLEKERDFFEIARPYENVTLYTDASKLPPNYLINHDQDDKLEPTMVSEDKEDLLEEEDDEIVPIKFRSEKQRLAAEHVIEILMGGGRRQSKVQTSGSNISPARKDDIRKRMKSERRLSETKSDHVQLYSELFMKKDIEHTEKPAFQSTVTSNKPFNIPEFDFLEQTELEVFKAGPANQYILKKPVGANVISRDQAQAQIDKINKDTRKKESPIDLMSPNLTKWASKGKKKVEEIYNLTGPRPNSVAISAIVEIESSKYTTPDRKPKKRTPQQDQTGIDKSKDQEKSNVHTEKTLSEKSGSPPISLGQMSKALAERLQKKKIEKESIAINLLVDLEDSESEPESVHEEEHVEEVLEIAAQREEVPEIISSQSSLSEISSATSSRTSLVETKTSIRKVKAEKIPTEEKHKPKISSGKKQRLSRIEPIKKPIDLDAKIKEMNQSKIHEKQAGLEKIKKERVKTEAEANLSQLATTARTNKSSSEIKPVLPPIVKDTQPEAILKDAQLHKDFPTVDVSVTNKKILTKEKEKEIPSIPRTSIASTNESTKSVLESKIDNHHVVKFKEPIKKLSILKPVNKPPTAILRNSITEPSKPKTEHVTDVKPAPVFNPVKQKTKPAIAPKVEYKKTSVSKPASAHPLVDFMESDDDDLISDVKSRSAKSSRKSYSRGSSRLSESTLYDMHLKEIDQKPWFPGMNGREVTVPNIVLVVIEVLQNGEEEAKIEAISAIVYFYNTFKDEFADPLSSIIIPLLDMIHDENDSVREKITRAIGDIGVYSDETVTALIQMLNDSIENVRKAAILSLSELGISTKTQLEDAMKQLNMLPQDKAKKRVVNYLDILIARQNQKRKEHTIEKKKVCKVWTIQVKHAADAVHEPTGSQMPTIPPFDIYSDSVGSLFEILQ